MKSDISIIICAYNEESNIKNAVRSVTHAVYNLVNNYEIIIVDDGSTDKTGKIADSLASKNSKIKVIHHKHNMGLGHSFRDGIAQASMSYLGGFPGDNDMSWISLRNLISEMGKADIVISYMVNPQSRSLLRRLISRLYVISINFLFGLKLRYYNGYFVAKLENLKDTILRSDRFTLFTEIIVKLIKSGYTYKEIPFKHTGRTHGKSKAISISSIITTCSSISMLFYDVYLNPKRKT